MAVLTEQDRVDVWAEFQRRNKDSWGAVTKQQIRTAVDDLDGWVNSNKASALAAISAPADTELTGAQVALLFSILVDKRWLKGA